MNWEIPKKASPSSSKSKHGSFISGAMNALSVNDWSRCLVDADWPIDAEMLLGPGPRTLDTVALVTPGSLTPGAWGAGAG